MNCSRILQECLALALAFATSGSQAAEKIKVLIGDGQNNHNYKAMTPFPILDNFPTETEVRKVEAT